MPHSNSPWTPEDDEILRDMWAKKVLVREIAAKLSRTRSAVVGRAHRLFLEKRENPIKNRKYYVPPRKEKTSKPALIRKPPQRIGHPWNARKMSDGRNAPNIPEGPPVEAPVQGVGGLWSRCQFIAGDANGASTFYCGQPIANPRKPYCAYHLRICFTAPRVKTEKNDAA